MTNSRETSPIRTQLENQLRKRILLLDGATGTMIQRHRLDESAFRGDRFKDHQSDLQGNNDILCLTQPDIIGGVHRAYLEAGADLIETNTFASTSIAQADYGLESIVYDLNVAAAQIAKKATDEFSDRNPDRPRFVAGAIGPMNRTLSISPDVNDPAFRAVQFEEVKDSYREQVRGLLDGGADLLLVETIFDTMNAKAALLAIEEERAARGVDVPLMISVNITIGPVNWSRTRRQIAIPSRPGRPMSRTATS